MDNIKISKIFRRIQLWGKMSWGRVTVSVRDMPSFIIIGTRKAGTTALFNYLGKHPDVILPFRKEIKFFGCNFFRGMEWYRSFFPHRGRLKNGQMTGEASPYYILHPLAAKRIKETLPEVKLIAMVRNPIDRAYSNYQLNVTNRIEHLSFEKALENEKYRLAGEKERILGDEHYPMRKHMNLSYLEQGRYVEQLERWFEYFDREQILLIKSEDFFEDTLKVYKQVLNHVGLKEWDVPVFLNPNPGKYGGMMPKTRTELAAYFKPYNERLYELVERDFGWDK